MRIMQDERRERMVPGTDLPAQTGQQSDRLQRWHCRKPGCHRLLMEYSPNTQGVQVKICEKCGSINRLENGQPRG